MDFIVEQDYGSAKVRIYLRSNRGELVSFIGIENDKLTEQTFNAMDGTVRKIKPLLEMPHMMAEEFFKAFQEYLSGKGIKTENENLLQGKLAATEKHLEDLRKHFDLVLNKVIEQ